MLRTRLSGRPAPGAGRLASLVTVALAGMAIGGCGSGSHTAPAVDARVTAASSSAARPKPSVEGTSDDDIPAYGHEASAADRQAITALVRRYYAAAAAADGRTACALLDRNLEHVIAEDYGQPPALPYSRGKTCKVVMAKIFRHLTHHPADLAATAVTGVRVSNNYAFAELSSKLTPKGEIFLLRERGKWTVGVPIGRQQRKPTG